MNNVPTTPDSPVSGGCTVSIRRVADLDHGAPLNPAAEFAIIADTAAGGPKVLATDADVINILATARAFAAMLGAAFITPEAVCGYCARPVPTGARYCATRDCSTLTHDSETRFRRLAAA